MSERSPRWQLAAAAAAAVTRHVVTSSRMRRVRLPMCHPTSHLRCNCRVGKGNRRPALASPVGDGRAPAVCDKGLIGACRHVYLATAPPTDVDGDSTRAPLHASALNRSLAARFGGCLAVDKINISKAVRLFATVARALGCRRAAVAAAAVIRLRGHGL